MLDTVGPSAGSGNGIQHIFTVNRDFILVIMMVKRSCGIPAARSVECSCGRDAALQFHPVIDYYCKS